jgi:hypothetical protein
MRALAQRWLTLHEEIQTHDKALEQLVEGNRPIEAACREVM